MPNQLFPYCLLTKASRLLDPKQITTKSQKPPYPRTKAKALKKKTTRKQLTLGSMHSGDRKHSMQTAQHRGPSCARSFPAQTPSGLPGLWMPTPSADNCGHGLDFGLVASWRQPLWLGSLLQAADPLRAPQSDARDRGCRRISVHLPLVLLQEGGSHLRTEAGSGPMLCSQGPGRA